MQSFDLRYFGHKLPWRKRKSICKEQKTRCNLSPCKTIVRNASHYQTAFSFERSENGWKFKHLNTFHHSLFLKTHLRPYCGATTKHANFPRKYFLGNILAHHPSSRSTTFSWEPLKNCCFSGIFRNFFFKKSIGIHDYNVQYLLFRYKSIIQLFQISFSARNSKAGYCWS